MNLTLVCLKRIFVSASVPILLCVTAAGTATQAAHAQTQAQKDSFRMPNSIPFPAENPYTIEKATLGKMLFFESRLSRDSNLNCASCHNPSFGWQVPFAKAIGAGGKPLGRKSPTTINHAWGKEFFWDGRAPTLEAQARGPIEADVEMDLPLATGVKRLAAIKGYRDLFAKAFPKDGLTEHNVLKAIATFERTIVTRETPFDLWLRGDEMALSSSAQRGFQLFIGKAACVTCHSGWNFTDNLYHDIGLPTADRGRAVISGKPADAFAMRTPGLREIKERAPYMHNGSLETLEQVVLHYASGGVRRPSLSPLLKPVELSEREVGDLVAFMLSLSSPTKTVAMPNMPAR